MRKFLTILLSISMMALPALSLAEAADTVSAEEATASYYTWISDTEFDMYELSMIFTQPEGWQHASQDILDAMNGISSDPTAEAEDAPLSTTLNPYVIALITNADSSVSTTFTCENLEDMTLAPDTNSYIKLLANDIVASSDGTVTYTYDETTIADATLATQPFLELAVYGSDDSIIDLLVHQSFSGSYYSFMIMGKNDDITAFAPDFLGALNTMDAVG